MDTPERLQIATPIANHEDSPVFNYINSLSPIQPVKSVHVTQTFNSLSFSSPPSVFASPHIGSFKESRFLKRNQSDPSKPEFSSENVNKVSIEEGIKDVVVHSVEHNELVGPNVDGLSHTLKYDGVSSNSNPVNIEAKCTSSSFDPHVEEVSDKVDKGLFGSEVHVGGLTQINQSQEAAECDWDALVSAADLLAFDSPSNTENLKDLGIDGFQTTQPDCGTGLSIQNELDNPSTQPGETVDLKEIIEKGDAFSRTSLENCMAEETSDKIDEELASNLNRGTRRRCLVFEMVGVRKKHFADPNIALNDKQIVPLKLGSESSRRVRPGFGLHLNALATTSMDHKVIKHETLASGGHLISMPRYTTPNRVNTTSIHSLTASQVPSDKFAGALSSENQVPDADDASLADGYMVNEEFNQSSPKKKRSRLGNAGEGESCKRCNCKKSKCLKLYCECFAAGVYCVEPCSCQECFNKPIHEDTVLATRKQIESRNPLAFAPKVIRTSDSIVEVADESNKTPASARHKRGCNCKKSGCLKKYCECYQSGVGCSINCRCEGCKNAFGRKDGTEAEPEEEETEESEKGMVDRALQKPLVQKETEAIVDSAPLATPLPFGRSSIQPPFASNKKPPRSSFLPIGSSRVFSSHIFGRPKFVLPESKFEKQFQPMQEGEMPEILHLNSSPVAGDVKSLSPNSKRVSPPHIGSSSGQRGSRKLILQSIPSFPSLTSKD